MSSIPEPGWRQESFWLRVVFVVFYFWCIQIALFFTLCLALLQGAVLLFGDQPNSKLQVMSHSLALFTRQVLDYVMFVSDTKPYPFTDWPDGSNMRD